MHGIEHVINLKPDAKPVVVLQGQLSLADLEAKKGW